jgi:hypothetical protein
MSKTRAFPTLREDIAGEPVKVGADVTAHRAAVFVCGGEDAEFDGAALTRPNTIWTVSWTYGSGRQWLCSLTRRRSQNTPVRALDAIVAAGERYITKHGEALIAAWEAQP